MSYYLIIIAALIIVGCIISKISNKRFYRVMEECGGIPELDRRIADHEHYLKLNHIYREDEWEWLDFLKDIRHRLVKRQRKFCRGAE